MGGTTIESTVSSGVSSLFGIAPIVTILVLIIIILGWFIKQLLADMKADRQKMFDVVVNCTAVVAEFKEMVRGALNQK